MVEYTQQERNMIDDSIAFYRSKNFPDYVLDANDPETILKACRFAHDKGSPIIKEPTQHAIWRSIRRKNGEKVEEPEETQARLAKERAAKRVGIILEAKKKEAEEVQAEADKVRKELEELQVESQRKEIEKTIDSQIAEAKKETLNAEQKAKAAEMEVERLKAELRKAKQVQQQAENMKNLEAAAEELAKGEDAKVIPEVQAILNEVEQKVEEKKKKDDSYIDDLVRELTE